MCFLSSTLAALQGTETALNVLPASAEATGEAPVKGKKSKKMVADPTAIPDNDLSDAAAKKVGSATTMRH
jgi:hypothetical protein